jgi:hypothetical protein
MQSSPVVLIDALRVARTVTAYSRCWEEAMGNMNMVCCCHILVNEAVSAVHPLSEVWSQPHVFVSFLIS